MGNQDFADFVDNNFGPQKLNYVVNGDDVVPHLVPYTLGARHFSGQIWINPTNSSQAQYYPGQENILGADSVLDPPLNTDAHLGVYLNTYVLYPAARIAIY